LKSRSLANEFSISFIDDKATIIQRKPLKIVTSLIFDNGKEKSKNIKQAIAKKDM
jgi:hypothetical protein|tara:strand:+ start:277 stop:441 length:165 start_codon:yes stop_codon:yes gene_type:complete